MNEASEHVFDRKIAAPALLQAMEALAQKSQRSLDDLDQITLGEAYQLACKVYGDELPEYWRVWNSWNQGPDSPAEMGEL